MVAYISINTQIILIKLDHHSSPPTKQFILPPVPHYYKQKFLPSHLLALTESILYNSSTVQFTKYWNTILLNLIPLTTSNPIILPLVTFLLGLKIYPKLQCYFQMNLNPSVVFFFSKNNEWSFRYGKSDNNKPIPLPDFYSHAHTLQQSLKLFQGHPKDKSINKLCQQHIFSNAIAKFISKHVSARGLTSENVPTLIQHKFLNANNKRIWDDAYSEEYQGLLDLPCCVTITEKQFQKERHKTIPKRTP